MRGPIVTAWQPFGVGVAVAAVDVVVGVALIVAVGVALGVALIVGVAVGPSGASATSKPVVLAGALSVAWPCHKPCVVDAANPADNVH